MDAPAPSWLTERPIAHRGLHAGQSTPNGGNVGRPIENTIAAAEAAAAGGFGIECDVQLSRDGEAVVFHDDTLDRLTAASGPLGARTLAELADIPFRDDPAARIPTLSAFLDIIPPATTVLVEIKSAFDGSLALARRVAKVIAGQPQRIALMSFDDEAVAEACRLAPERPCGLVTEASYSHSEWDFLPAARRAALSAPDRLERLRPAFLAWRVSDLPHPLPASARQSGRPVLTWTVRTPADRAIAAAHADQIIFEGFRPDGERPRT